jgi:hypothetical protein
VASPVNGRSNRCAEVACIWCENRARELQQLAVSDEMSYALCAQTSCTCKPATIAADMHRSTAGVPVHVCIIRGRSKRSAL